MDALPEDKSNPARRRFDSSTILMWKQERCIAFGEDLVIRMARTGEFSEILAMLNDSGGIVRPYPEMLKLAIEERRSMVAVHRGTEEIIAHQRYEKWDDLRMTELRTAFVKPLYRGRGLNTMMKQLIVSEIFDVFPGWSILGFCKPSSLSKNIFLRVGFEPLSLEVVREKWSELSRECRTNDCYLVNKHGCGCAVSLLTEHVWKEKL